MEKFENPEAICGDYLNNEEVDEACMKRLLNYAKEYSEGSRHKVVNLLKIVAEELDIFFE